MEENPYKPPTEYEDVPDGALVSGVNAILNVVITLFLTCMMLVSLGFLAAGTLGFLFGNLENGIISFSIGAFLGLVTCGAVVLTVRRKR